MRDGGQEQAGVSGQETSVDAVIFGEQAAGQGEVADACGLDACDREVAVQGGVEDRAFVSAGGFQDDEGGMEWFESIQERDDAGGIVGEGLDRVDAVDGEVELVLGDVDAQVDGGRSGGLSHVCCPSLRMRACEGRSQRLSRLFGLLDTASAWTTLGDGLGVPRHDRSWADVRARVTPRCARRPAGTTRGSRTR